MFLWYKYYEYNEGVYLKRIAKFIVKHYRFILVFYILITILMAFFATKVGINYQLSDYLPEDAASVKALEVMKSEFNEPLPNLRIARENTSIAEALAFKKKLLELSDVKLVLWLDDYLNTTIPVELMDPMLLETYYDDQTMLFEVAVESENASISLQEIKRVMGEGAHYSGDMVAQASSQSSTNSEITTITMFMVPIGLIILMFSITSWMEPFLLLISIGIAIVLNMGTNIFLGEVSFITQAVTAILQLAVSMDYAIFLLHSYEQKKLETEDKNEALALAIVDSSSAVISSAMTTVFGFIVLVFMRFEIGKDLGLVLAKGVAFSLLSVITFLPVLIRIFSRWEEKFSHRNFLPNFKPLAKGVFKVRKFLLIVLLIIPIVFLAQSRNDFLYGMGGFEEDSVEQLDEKFIQDHFQKNTQFVILAPRGEWGKEIELIQKLREIPEVSFIQSYTEQVGTGLPTQIIPEESLKKLISDRYSRIVLNTRSDNEGARAFELVERIRKQTKDIYGDRAHVVGESVTIYDMREFVQKDNKVVNLLAILSVAAVIMISFKSLSLPVILVLTIEASIWINLSVPYFTGTKLSFIGYLVISSIQLGATVDYGILYTNNYLKLRKKLPKKEAIIEAGALTYGSILPPGIILTFAGILLSVISSIRLVSELGTVLGRGAALSLLLVMFLLPTLLYHLDPLIEKTTRKANFFKE